MNVIALARSGCIVGGALGMEKFFCCASIASGSSFRQSVAKLTPSFCCVWFELNFCVRSVLRMILYGLSFIRMMVATLPAPAAKRNHNHFGAHTTRVPEPKIVQHAASHSF